MPGRAPNRGTVGAGGVDVGRRPGGRAGLAGGAGRLLVATALWGVAQGVQGVVFNLFLLAYGYDTPWLGFLAAASSLAGFAAAVPAGRLADRVGARTAVLWGGAGGALALAASALWPQPLPLLVAQLLGAATGTLAWVSMTPLLSEHAGRAGRDAFFSVQFAVSTVAAALGHLLGGVLPGAWAAAAGVPPASVPAYRGALLVAALLTLAALAPVAALRAARRPGDGAAGAPAPGPAEPPRRGLLLRFGLTSLVVGVGAGFLVPLQNVFFAQRFGASAAQIGLIFSWSNLAIAAAALAAPALSARWGRVRMVATVQLASIPFIAAMALAPGLWWAAAASWARAALMNMANPVSSAFLMDCFPPGERATASAVTTMAWTLGWAAGAQGAGLLMAAVSPAAPLWVTAAAYAVGALLYLRLFAPLEGAAGAGTRRLPGGTAVEGAAGDGSSPGAGPA